MNRETTNFNRKTALELSQRFASNLMANLSFKAGVNDKDIEKAMKMVSKFRNDFFDWLEEVNEEEPATPAQKDYLWSLMESTGAGDELNPDRMNYKQAEKAIVRLKDYPVSNRLTTQKDSSKELKKSIDLDGDGN